MVAASIDRYTNERLGIAGLAEHVRYARPNPPFARGGKGSLAPSFDRARHKHAPRNRPSSTVNTNFS